MPRPGTAPALFLLALLVSTAAASALGCGAAAPARPDGMTAPAATAARVFAILEQHNASGVPEPKALSEGAFDHLLRALDPQSGCAARQTELGPERAGFANAARNGEFGAVQRAALICTGRGVTAARAEALAFDAVARAFDPHAGFVDAAALTALERAQRPPLAEAQKGRARIVEADGFRIGWIALPSFYTRPNGRSSLRDFGFLLDKMAAEPYRASFIVLDLRGNAGGAIDEALRLSAVLCGQGTIAHERRAGGTRELHTGFLPGLRPLAGAFVLVIDGRTAGASEVVAASVADRGCAKLVGERTRGQGNAQTLVWLQSPQGARAGAVRVTDRYYVRLSGQPIEGQGVAPDLALGPEDASDEAIARRIVALLRQASPGAVSAP
jgi:hypothetical protein